MVVGKTFVKQMAKRLAEKAIIKTLLKAGAKVTGATVGGTAAKSCFNAGDASATAACLAGSAVAGIITWLVIDKATVEMDEFLNKKEFKIKVISEIDSEKQKIKNSLKEKYRSLLIDSQEISSQSFRDAKVIDIIKGLPNENVT
jgi:hypothetical protein